MIQRISLNPLLLNTNDFLYDLSKTALFAQLATDQHACEENQNIFSLLLEIESNLATVARSKSFPSENI